MVFSITDIIIIILILIPTIFGLIKGIIPKLSGLLSFVLSGTITYYIATPIASLLVGTDFYSNLQNAIGNWAPAILEILCYVVIFVIFLLLIKIFMHFLLKAIAKGKIAKTIDKLLGSIFGLATGLFIATIYLLIFYGLTKVSPSIQAFYVSDLSLNTDSFTISKVLMKYINILFYNI
ncbi:MAG: CvpA family protein [Candidatus Onthovivens sp.]|nr:CvpA family protein [Candidatus Onthovivens sp.]